MNQDEKKLYLNPKHQYHHTIKNKKGGKEKKTCPFRFVHIFHKILNYSAMRGTHCDRDILLKRAKCFRNDTLCCVCVCVWGREFVRFKWRLVSTVVSSRSCVQHQDHSVWLSTVHAGPFPSLPGLRAHQNIDHPVEIIEE